MRAAGAVVGLMELVGGLQVSAAQPLVVLRCAWRVNPPGIGDVTIWRYEDSIAAGGLIRCVRSAA